MAALDEMKVKISADIKDLVTKLDQGGISLSQFGKQVSATASKLGTDVTKGSNSAALALQNFGRIAQDAPFGIIGITNNINPMLESFQRLKAETGSTGTALKAMVSGLMGPAGLGVAVSLGTALLTELALKGFFKTEKAADDAKKKIDSYKEAVSGIFSDAAKEVTNVQSLITVLESETATRKRKLAAIKELQQINPEVFGGLKLEGNLVVGLNEAYKSYLDNIKTVIAVKIKQQQLEDITKKILEKEGVTLTGTAKTLRNIVKAIEDKNIAQNKDNANNPFITRRIKDINELNSLHGQSATLLKEIGELSQGVEINSSAFNEKKIKTTRTYQDVLKQLNEELALNNKLADIGFLSSQELDESKIQRTKAAIEEILKLKKGPGVNSSIISDLIASIEPEEARTQLTERLKEVVKTIRPSELRDLSLPEVKIKLRTDPTITTDLAESQAILNDELKRSAELVGVLKPAFDEMFSSIANGGSVFEAIGNSVKSLAIKLAEAAIEAALFSVILNAFGLSALGGNSVASLFATFSGLPKIGKNADGTNYWGGGLTWVGERGKELINLPQGSQVIPNHRLESVTGSSMQVFIPELKIRGADLLIAFNRANQQNNRRG